MKSNFLRIVLGSIVWLSCTQYAYNKRPRLTVILDIDQCAYSYIPKLSCNLKNGIKFLLQHGIVYQNANYPHGMPSTGPGHANLAAGITSDYTGITGNNWGCQGNKVSCDDDDPIKAAVINPLGGVYDYGKGPAHIMVDNISDQYALSAQPDDPRVAISLSLKSRSAICTADKLGKAIWLDKKTGYFTSSKAYYHTLPSWLMNFNRNKALNRLTKITWPLYYPRNSSAYNFKEIDNYKYSARPSIVGKTLPINWGSQNPLELYERTPAANQLMLDLALHCIKTHVTRNSCQEMLLWVCLSSLDMIGHEYGPQSREVIDMLYHLDCQIGQFMQEVSCYVKRTDTLFVLTADHGVSPIPEILNEQGYESACRINFGHIIPELNKMLASTFGVAHLLSGCFSSQIYFNTPEMERLEPDQQMQAVQLVQQQLSAHQGIKKVWTQEELKNSCFGPDQLESFYQHQIFPGRSGALIIQPYPYCIPDEFGKGTGHRTPYEPDTHVPLILYQKRNLEKRIIYEKVWTLQLANSLALILGIQQPSASTYHILPGLIDYDPITGEVIQTVVL